MGRSVDAELFSFLVGEAKQNRLLVIGTLTTDGERRPTARTTSSWEHARAKERASRSSASGRSPSRSFASTCESLLGEITSRRRVRALDVLGVGRLAAEHPPHLRLPHRARVSRLDSRAGGRSTWSASARCASRAAPASILMEKVEALHDDELFACSKRPRSSAKFRASTCSRRSPTSRRSEPTSAARARRRLGCSTSRTSGRVITFPQMHLRDAIYNGMTERRRRELHLRVGNALEPMLEAGSSQLVGQIAYHFARANETDQRRALRGRGGRHRDAHARARGGDRVLSHAPSS